MNPGRAVDSRVCWIDRTRILALLVLALPGLLLSWAVHLCICLGALAAGGGTCASAAPDCCARFAPGSAAEDAADCGDCCIAIDNEGSPPMAPWLESQAGLESVALAPIATVPAPSPCTAQTLAPRTRAVRYRGAALAVTPMLGQGLLSSLPAALRVLRLPVALALKEG